MNVVICSAFRNSTGYIDRYFAQVDALSTALAKRGDHLSLILGYGDSDDGTGEHLFEAATLSIGARLIDVSHGGPVFASVVDAQRFKQLAYVGNRILANVPSDADVVIWIESDLIWKPETLARLIYHKLPVVAPMVYERRSGGFYDTWGFVKNGLNFTKHYPYHRSLLGVIGIAEVDSVGSCVVMRGDVAKGLVIPEADLLVGACRELRNNGYTIWLDSSLEVLHP